ncbi:NAM-associated domain-containing protein [Forsythia ovata]|uniref:NAM-associated domain-containing protein n=1 Tax=Forsythia ovata TaxID=205694 RepID=A0ABD1P1L8_9LAMI
MAGTEENEETTDIYRTKQFGKKFLQMEKSICHLPTSLPSIPLHPHPFISPFSHWRQQNRTRKSSILVRNPKWCSKELPKKNVFNRQKFNNINSPTIDESLPNLGDDPMTFEGINYDDVARPQGRKSCKEKKRKLNKENCDDCIEQVTMHIRKTG